MEPSEQQSLNVEAAIERLSKVAPHAKIDPSAPVQAPAPSKLNPKNWPPKVKAVVIAALVAGLAAAGVPGGIVAAISSLLGG